MVGPPGTGKSMLAARFPGILPQMSEAEALQSAAVQSLEGNFDVTTWKTRPYRAPHHTASGVALVGGGGNPRPGEISMALHGVLFLDELPEFDRNVLEVLREPMESGRITISSTARRVDFPAQFQLIAAMNPCPCGYQGHYNGKCRCTPDQISRYRSKISGPLLDRIDIQIEVPAVPQDDLINKTEGEDSAPIQRRVESARQRQIARQEKPMCNFQGRRSMLCARRTNRVFRFCNTPSAASGCRHAHIIACSKWRALSPTSKAKTPSPANISPKRYSIGD